MGVPVILFVDDEPMVLSGIRRMLRPRRGDWETLFAQGGAEALKILAERNVDVVVSDVSMPGMDGFQLLSEVKTRRPHAARVILTGHVRRLEDMARSVAHFHLAKPLDGDSLLKMLESLFRAREIVSGSRSAGAMARLDRLPAVSEVHTSLIRELDSLEPSPRRLGELLARDVGLSARLLSMVNSPFFGFAREIARPEEALPLLGVEMVKAFVLTVQVFSSCESSCIGGGYLRLLWDHCLRVSRLSTEVARAWGLGNCEVDECRVCGLLHDVGKAAMVSEFHDEYEEVVAMAGGGVPVWKAEIEVFGFSHAQAGAYVMGLWGMSPKTLDMIAGHHESGCLDAPGPGAAVCAANILDRQLLVINDGYHRPELDADRIEALGVPGGVQGLMAVAADVLGQDREEHA